MGYPPWFAAARGGHSAAMPQHRWNLQRTVRRVRDGISIAADVNAQVAVNTGPNGQRSHVTVVSPPAPTPSGDSDAEGSST